MTLTSSGIVSQKISSCENIAISKFILDGVSFEERVRVAVSLYVLCRNGTCCLVAALETRDLLHSNKTFLTAYVYVITANR